MPELTPDDVGRRVSLRRRDPAPGAPGAQRDTVGVLEAADSTHLVVRRRDGTLVSVSRSDVVAARVVPPPPARLRHAVDVDAATLEQIASLGWPALETAPLGEWLLRAAGGFTGRANSVLPLGSPAVTLDDALTEVVRWYRERGLVPRIQVPLPLRADLDDQLGRRGWSAYDPVRVLVADVDDVLMAVPRPAAPEPTTSRGPSDAWLAAYHYREQELPAVARTVMAAGAQPLFVSLADAVGVVAVARGAVDAGWLGVTAVEVGPRARRRGFGTALMLDLLTAGRARGARFTYLQVAEENVPARALYRQLGYRDHHGYHYRRWDG